MNRNLEITYLYRDGGNNKKYQSVVIANPEGITPDQLEQAIRSRFSALQVWPDVLHVQPEILGWSTAFFPDHDPTDEDLTVHEIDGISWTEEAARFPALGHQKPLKGILLHEARSTESLSINAWRA